MQRIVNRTFDRLVKFGERAVGEGCERPEDSADAFGIHDEWAHVIFRLGVGLEIGNVVASPFLRGFVPPHLFSCGIERFAVEVAGRAIVKDAAIRRPGQTPVRMHTQTRRIRRIAARGLIARFGKCAGINPVAAGGRAVVFQPGKAGKLLAGFDLLLGGGIFEIRERLSVDFLQYLGQRRIGGVGVIPRQFQDGIGKFSRRPSATARGPAGKFAPRWPGPACNPPAREGPCFSIAASARNW